MRRMMDEVEFQHQPGAGTTATLRKRIEEPAAAEEGLA